MKNDRSASERGKDSSKSKKGGHPSKADVPDSTQVAWNAELGAPDYRTQSKNGDQTDSSSSSSSSKKSSSASRSNKK